VLLRCEAAFGAVGVKHRRLGSFSCGRGGGVLRSTGGPPSLTRPRKRERESSVGFRISGPLEGPAGLFSAKARAEFRRSPGRVELREVYLQSALRVRLGPCDQRRARMVGRTPRVDSSRNSEQSALSARAASSGCRRGRGVRMMPAAWAFPAGEEAAGEADNRWRRHRRHGKFSIAHTFT